MSKPEAAAPLKIDSAEPLPAERTTEELLIGCGGQLGFGAVAGYVSGYAMRTVGRIAAFTLGSGFIILQSLQYMGYVNVNWRAVERTYTNFLDLDGDGEITTKDAAIAMGKIKDILIFDLPAGCGFTAGWIYGLGGPTTLAGKVGAAGLAYGVGTRVLLPRVAATVGATTGGPAAVVSLKKFFNPDPSPEEVFRGTIADKGLADLKKLQKTVEKQLGARKVDPVVKSGLLMERRILEEQIRLKAPAVPPAPPGGASSTGRSWWKFW